VAIKLSLLTVLVIVLSLLVGLADTVAATGTTMRVSVGSGGIEGNDHSWGPAHTADGRYVLFESYASNLVASDTNATLDVFIHDRETLITQRISLDSAGNQVNGASRCPCAITGDSRYAVFWSWASNLVPGDTNNDVDVFVYDRQLGLVERIGGDIPGLLGNTGSHCPCGISEGGRYVAFSSWAKLTPADTNGTPDVYVRDRATGATERANVASDGTQGNHHQFAVWCCVAISADGRYVVFPSVASNLVPGDDNFFCDTNLDGNYVDNCPDVFVRDRQSGTTELVSVATSGHSGMGRAEAPTMSSDGRYVAFMYSGSDMVAGDTNSAYDVFVRDRSLGTTERISIASDGSQVSGQCYCGISSGGRYVTFYDGQVGPGDTNGVWDAFVHDRVNDITEQVSVNTAGVEGNRQSFDTTISNNGRYVLFASQATNLAPTNSPYRTDIFLRDLGDWDNDGEWDPFDPDDDNDTLLDTMETACGSDPLSASSRPERTDTAGDDDGDGLVNEALPPGSGAYDCDGDTFSGSLEQYVFSATNAANDQKRCGEDAWPVDINNDSVSDITDIALVGSSFGKAAPPAPVRHNVAPDPSDGFVDITDIARVGSFFGKGCRL
jgi:Tol biopolymer transport system component